MSVLQLPPESGLGDVASLRERVWAAIASHPEHTWPWKVLEIRPEEVVLRTRAELAAYFRRNGLRDLAKRVEQVNVRRGQILLLVEREDLGVDLRIATPTRLTETLGPSAPLVFRAPANAMIDPRDLLRTSARLGLRSR